MDEEVRLLAADAGFDPDEPLQEIFRQAKVDQDYALGLDIFVALHNLLIDAETAMSGAFEGEIEKDLVMVPVFQGAFFEPAALDGSRRAAFYAGLPGRMHSLICRPGFIGKPFRPLLSIRGGERVGSAALSQGAPLSSV